MSQLVHTTYKRRFLIVFLHFFIIIISVLLVFVRVISLEDIINRIVFGQLPESDCVLILR